MEEGFAKWSGQYVLFCHVTSNVSTDPHQKLLQEKGGRGFPYLVFMDQDGNVLAKHEGPRNVEGFSKTSEKVQSFLDLKKKAESGDKDAKVDLLIVQIELGHFKADEARNRAKELKDVPPEKQKRIDSALANMEVMEIVQTVTRDRATRIAAGRKCLEMKKAGRVPSGDQETQIFWILIMDVAEEDKDAALFEEGLNALKTKFGDKVNKRWLEQNEARLNKLKENK